MDLQTWVERQDFDVFLHFGHSCSSFFVFLSIGPSTKDKYAKSECK